MLVALSIGIAISSSFYKRLKIVSQADMSSRAGAVAQAGVEHMLLLPQSTLNNYVTNNSCGSNCVVQITGADNVVATANVELSRLGSSTAAYGIDLLQSDMMQVNLSGYPQNTALSVCWNEPNMSVFTNYIYGTSGSYLSDSYSYNAVGSTYGNNGFSNATAAFGYSSCFTFTTKANSVMLRLKSIYTDGQAFIRPATNVSIPQQGILVKSIGSAGTTRKTLSVVVSDSVVPIDFDYVLYQKSATDPLSN